MDAHWLRERFLRPRPYVPISLGDRPDSPPAAALWPAAVLIALVDRPNGLQVLLERRTAHLHHHAGQISFPGGRMEPEDRSAEAAALRETETR